MSVLDTAAALLAEYGDSYTLAREGEGTTVTLKGRRFGGSTERVGAGTAEQQVFRVKVGTAELLASAWSSKVPKRGDKITIDSRARTVRDARPIKEGSTTGLYELEVAG